MTETFAQVRAGVARQVQVHLERPRALRAASASRFLGKAIAAIRRRVGNFWLRAAGTTPPESQSLWVGFWLDGATARALAVPDGELAGELHVTLCYVPEVGPTQATAAVAALRTRTQAGEPFTGQVTGGGRFDAGEESGALDVLYAVPDLTGLAAFRQELVQVLSALGAVPSREHDFVPHIALKYVSPDSDETVDPPAVPLAFDALEVRFGDEILARLPFGVSALAKAEGDDPEAELGARVQAILDSLDLTGFATLVDPTTAVLEEVARRGASQGLLTVKALVPEADDFPLPGDDVAAWASERAAALVGKRVLADGTVIENPRAEYAIDEATREMLRGTIADAFREEQTFPELQSALENAYAFSEERARLIARTEVGGALAQGNLESWRASGVVDQVEWLLSDLHDEDDECDDLADGGPYALDEVPDFPHPRCACDWGPIVTDETA